MAAANDLGTRVREIKNLVAANEIIQALGRLIDLARDFRRDLENETIILISNYRYLEGRVRQSLLAGDEADRKRSQLLHQLLLLVDEIELNPHLTRAS